MEEKKKINIGSKIILLVVLLCCVLAYFFVPAVNKVFNKIFVMFASGDFSEVKQFISSYGGYAAAISFALMVLQSIVAPLPVYRPFIDCCQGSQRTACQSESREGNNLG